MELALDDGVEGIPTPLIFGVRATASARIFSASARSNLLLAASNKYSLLALPCHLLLHLDLLVKVA